MRQNKLGKQKGSTSVIKTLEYMVQNKWQEITDLNDQVRILNSFYEMAKIKLIIDEKPENNRRYIQSVLELTD